MRMHLDPTTCAIMYGYLVHRDEDRRAADEKNMIRADVFFLWLLEAMRRQFSSEVETECRSGAALLLS